MTTHPLPFDPALARLVKTDTLTPCQQKTRPNFKTACDFRQKHMIKHPFLSDFHCWAEYLHAGLLEGDPTVTSYIPQPYLLRIRQTWYTPDNYVVRSSQPRQIEELKPKGEMPEDKQIPLTHYFAQQGFKFVVISNESVYERQIEAENWLEIVTILHQSKNFDTADAEEILLESLYKKNNSCTLGDLIDPGDRERTYMQEIAMFRLLHQGHLIGTLSETALDYDTGISL